MTDWILWAVRTFGYPILAVGLFVEGLGLPFPGQITLLFAGFLASRGDLALPWLAATAAAGALAGTLTAYGIGRGQGGRLARWFQRLGVPAERVRQAEETMARWGVWGYLVGRFIPTLGNVTPYLAGAGGAGLAVFSAAAVLHVAVWTGLPVAGGFLLGSRWPALASRVGKGGEWLGVATFFGLLAFWLYRRTRRRRQPAP
ncbi:DedA family protein [Limnochorda pilosa]|uniref:VTT domain-containing protein n=1 Tax=Limnochorda pilosa TaxID=1555112 RepID=A0A0K2SIW7_LIMPI|nr:VTT domain-containing protein [Limnochorda pilosa]BAS26972.1 hypothetical protein LIP_1115 [Limnochorda pilosa]